MDNQFKADKPLALALFITAVLIATFWTTWFIVPNGKDFLASRPDDVSYIIFENAFVLADSWLAFAALMAGGYLWRGSVKALGWLYITASGAIFLAFMDILYNLQNGIYVEVMGKEFSAIATEMGINVATLTIAAWALTKAHSIWQVITQK